MGIRNHFSGAIQPAVWITALSSIRRMQPVTPSGLMANTLPVQAIVSRDVVASRKVVVKHCPLEADSTQW